jgi:hypothetical protein
VTQGDCAFGCLNVNYRFEFDSDGAYAFAEEHRSTENEGGLPFTCIDETYYVESGTASADNSSLLTTPTSATAQHTNNCHPETNFDHPVGLVNTQYHWQVSQTTGGNVQLYIGRYAGQGLTYTRQSAEPTPPPSSGSASVVQTLAQPQRLVDTRASGGPIGSGSLRCFDVAGQKGIPADAAGVALNVTATGYARPGWITVYPAGQSAPSTSTLNFDPSAYAIANGTITSIGAGGQVCVSAGTVNSAPGGANVVLDATGYVPAGSSPQLTLLAQPRRLMDTRAGGGPIMTGASRCFPIAGQSGIPVDARGLVLNVAATGYATRGWVTLYPAGQTAPSTSTVNFDPSAYAIANGTLARIGDNGQLCVTVGTVDSTPGSAQVVVDVVGYLPAVANPQLVLLPEPQRLVDTRVSHAPIASGSSSCFNVAGQKGVPANASSLVLNVTGSGYTAPGWISLYPAGQQVPATSSLNFDSRAYAMANNTIAHIGAGGQVCVNVGTVDSVPGSSHVILDVVGYLTGN